MMMVLMAMMLKVVLNACSCLVYSPLGGKTDRIAGSPVYRGCKILDTTASHKLKPANKFDSNNRVWGVFTVSLLYCSKPNIVRIANQKLPGKQGGRTWQAFGGGKNGHETFRQARI